MHEHAVMAIIGGFTDKHLSNQTLMGFAVIDEDQMIMVASSFDHEYGKTMANPIKRWIIYECYLEGFKAFELKEEDDFKAFTMNHFRAASA
jgi:hypothetical protein